jgi:hypothetical protein
VDIKEYYLVLNRLASRSPKLFGRTQYCLELGFELNPTLHDKESYTTFFHNSVLKEEFEHLQGTLMEQKFEGVVEDFYVKSYMGNNILLGSFSNFGVDSEKLSPFVSKTALSIFKERMDEASTYVFMEDLAFWFLSHQWNANLNQVGMKQLLELLPSKNVVEHLPLLETLSSVEERFFEKIVKINPSHVEQLLNPDSMLDVELSAQTGERFWRWDDQYYYGDLAQTYRYLQHPFLKKESFMNVLFDFNVKAAGLSSSYKKSVFSPYILEVKKLDVPLRFTEEATPYLNAKKVKEKITETYKIECSSCGVEPDSFLETGHTVRVVETKCHSCLYKHHALRKMVISSAADHWTKFSSAFLLLLENRKYNVLTEEQLIGLALEFPGFKDEILSAGNATVNVAAAFALNPKK